VYAVDAGKCVKAGDCINACPVGAIDMRDEGAFIRGEDCTDCAACEAVCDAKAIHQAE
jgi:NAD-dependent dihydropyrimidine dehydrogenase PreA subunit